MLIWYIILKYCLIFKRILENLVLYEKEKHHANVIISVTSNNYGSQVLLIDQGG